MQGGCYAQRKMSMYFWCFTFTLSFNKSVPGYVMWWKNEQETDEENQEKLEECDNVGWGLRNDPWNFKAVYKRGAKKAV